MHRRNQDHGLFRDGLPEGQLEQAVARYRVVVDCPDYVRGYLGRFPGLTPHVVAAVEKARQTFGELPQLTLTINDDPEAFDPYLKMYVSLPKYGPDTGSIAFRSARRSDGRPRGVLPGDDRSPPRR